MIISSDSKKSVNENFYKRNTQNSIIGYWLVESKNKAHNLFDITKVNWNDFPKDIDIFTYSFPCQDISNQGKQRGFSKDSKSRSGLLWEIDRLLSDLKINKENLPNYLLLENVKAIVNKNHIETFNLWKDKLDELGYLNHQYILNSADFGSCQSRQRVFLLSVKKTHQKSTGFQFQQLKNRKSKTIIDTFSQVNSEIIFNKKFNNFKLSEFKLTPSNINKAKLLNYTNFQSENYVFDINFQGPTLTASGALSRLKFYYGKNKIHEISPIESFLYMGFKKEDYFKVKETKLVSDIKFNYLAGNSISVEVLEAIFETLVFS